MNNNVFKIPKSIIICENEFGRYEPYTMLGLADRNKTRKIIEDLKFYIKNYTDSEIDFLNSKA